jgi:signal transduction histidine kinase
VAASVHGSALIPRLLVRMLDIAVICLCLAGSPLNWSTASGGLLATGRVLSLLGITVVAGLLNERQLGRAETIAANTAAVISAREDAAAQRARHDERMIQYRLLHDTVLPTLNAIAGGDAQVSAQLRQRCAAEADALRSMISGGARPATPLVAELALVVRHQAALGLRVHSNVGELPQALPPAATAALVGSCREALNNVAKHAGTGEAWLTACTSPDGAVVISVVDRGRGFDPEFVTAGLGMSQSIAARMAEAGGTSKADSGVGQGTCVELRWPR